MGMLLTPRPNRSCNFIFPFEQFICDRLAGQRHRFPFVVSTQSYVIFWFMLYFARFFIIFSLKMFALSPSMMCEVSARCVRLSAIGFVFKS